MIFDEYISRWNLIPDGDEIITHSSRLLPVQYQGLSTILKIAISPEERQGNFLMIWWNGKGAAPVLLHDNHALLMERAIGIKSLVEMATHGQDDEASRIIFCVVEKLHAHKENPPELLTLKEWFKDLRIAAPNQGGIFKQSLSIAEELLNTSQENVVLHGDIHHENILDFGDRGWLAIDPKNIQGERGYDYANLFCNPNLEVATRQNRLNRQLEIVANAAKLDKNRLLKWIIAYAGLSATWSINYNENPELALTIAKLAIADLSN